MVYRLFMKRSNIMNIPLIVSLVVLVLVLVTAEYYLKNMYYELEFLRIENVALKLKLAELIGDEDDQA
nr:MAG TPA: hypothetical protein [Bacteriophage sp.]